MKKVTFYYGDPSTYNHFLPIHNNINNSQLINLNNCDNFNSDIGIYGLSTNQKEVFIEKYDNFKILYIEGLVGNRLKGVETLDFNLILVCNNKCKDFIASRFSNKVDIVGDTFYNQIILNNKNLSLKKKFYTLFLSPDDNKMDKELLNINNFFDTINLIKKYSSNIKILIRFHPRTSKKFLSNIKKNYVNDESIFFDNSIKNDKVIRNSIITFGIGTSMYYESILNNVPSCFININKKFSDIYSLFNMEDIILICSENSLKQFINEPYIKDSFKNNHLTSIKKFINVIKLIK